MARWQCSLGPFLVPAAGTANRHADDEEEQRDPANCRDRPNADESVDVNARGEADCNREFDGKLNLFHSSMLGHTREPQLATARALIIGFQPPRHTNRMGRLIGAASARCGVHALVNKQP
jgi:hypothetical protein